mgnify:CR=1 FL=1
MKRAIYDGVLLLDESLPYEVVELPLPRDSPVELLEPESGAPRPERSGEAGDPGPPLCLPQKRGAGLL